MISGLGDLQEDEINSGYEEEWIHQYFYKSWCDLIEMTFKPEIDWVLLTINQKDLYG